MQPSGMQLAVVQWMLALVYASAPTSHCQSCAQLLKPENHLHPSGAICMRVLLHFR